MAAADVPSPASPARPVEWHLAGMFDCDACGRENFFRCTLVRPGADALDGTPHVVRPPPVVTCAACGATFEPHADV